MATKTQLSNLKKEDLVILALSLESKAVSAEQLAITMAAELAEERKFSTDLQEKIAGVLTCVAEFLISMPTLSKFNFMTVVANWKKIIHLITCVNSELELFKNLQAKRATKKATKATKLTNG